MSKPRVYIAAGSSQPVERRIGDWTRVSFNGCGDGSRSLEVYMDPRGIWTVNHGPGPGYGGGGEMIPIARGCLPTDFEFSGYSPLEVGIQVDPVARPVDLDEVRRKLVALEKIKMAVKSGDNEEDIATAVVIIIEGLQA